MPKAPRARKSVHSHPKKEKQKFSNKTFADRNKVVCLQPLKTATLAAEKFIKIMFVAVGESEKKLSKKLQKTLWDLKKGCIFAPA